MSSVLPNQKIQLEDKAETLRWPSTYNSGKLLEADLARDETANRDAIRVMTA